MDRRLIERISNQRSGSHDRAAAESPRITRHAAVKVVALVTDDGAVEQGQEAFHGVKKIRKEDSDCFIGEILEEDKGNSWI